MSIVDNRVVQMLFDNKQFESGVKESQSSLNNLNRMLDGMSGTSAAGSALNELAEKFNHLGIVGITVIQNLVNKITNDLTSAIKSVSLDQISAGFKKYEDKMTSVQTIMSATTDTWKDDAIKTVQSEKLLAAGFNENIITPLQKLYQTVGADGKATTKQLKEIGITMEQWNNAMATMKGADYYGSQMDYVSEQMERLNWFTDETSYNFTDMTSNIGKFTSQNVPLSEAVTAMEGIALWAAKSGQNAQSASRAMYNMSQALGVGSVKLMDWKSIENANMATAEFKKTAMDTAVTLGMLTEKAGKYFTKTLKGGKAVEVTVQNFSQTLSEAWFTSDVLLATLDKYGGFANEIGKVTEAFSDQGLTTTKLLQGLEAIYDANGKIDSSNEKFKSWLASTRIESASLVTELERLAAAEYKLGREAFIMGQQAKTFTEAMDAAKDAVSTAWMNLFETIFGNYEEARVIWTNLANSLYTIFAEPVYMLTDFLDQLGAADAIKSALKWIDKLADKFYDNVVVNSEDIIDTAITIINFFKGVLNGFGQFVKSVIDPIKEAFRNIFPEKTAGDITTAIAKILWPIDKLFLTFKANEETTDRLRRTFEGLFAILDLGKEAFFAILRVIQDIIPEFKGLGEGILDGTANFGDFLVAIRDSIKENDTFYNVLKKVADFVVPIFKKIFEILGKVITKFSEWFQLAKESGIIDTLTNSIKNLKNKLVPLSTILGKIKEVAKEVWGFLKGVFDSIKTFISGIDFSNVDFGSILTTGIEAGAGIGLIALIKSIKDFFNGISEGGLMKKLEEIADSLDGIFGKIKGALQGFTNDLNAGAILKVAAAVFLLALALAMFTGLANTSGIEDGLLAMTTAFGALFAALKVMDTIKTKVTSSAAALLLLSIAMLILAGAIAAFAAVVMMPTWEKGFQLFVVTLTAVTLALTALGKIGPEVLAAATAMLILSTAMLVLAIALAAFAAVALMPSFMDGLLGFAATLAACVIALQQLSALGPTVLAAGAAILLVAGAMVLFAAALAAFAAVALMPSFMDGLLAFGLTLAAVVIGLNFLSTLGPEVIASAAAILILSVAMIALAAALAAFSAIAMMDTFGTGLVVMAGSLLFLTMALMALGAAGPEVIIGAAALLIGAAAIAALAVAVGVCAVVLPLLSAGLRSLLNVIMDVANQIVELVFKIIEQGADAIVTIADAISQAVEVLFEGISSAIASLGEGLGSAIVAIGEGLGEAVAALAEGIGSAISSLGEGIGTAIQEVGEGIGAAIEAVLESIGTGIGKGLEAIAEGISKVGQSISDVGAGLGDAGDGIKRFGDGVRSLIGIDWIDIAGGLNNVIPAFKNLAKVDLSGITNSLSGVVNSINSVVNAITTMVQGVTSSIASFASVMENGMKQAGENGVRALVSALNSGTSQVTSTAQNIGKAGGSAAYQYNAWRTSGYSSITAFVSGLQSGVGAISSIGRTISSNLAQAAGMSSGDLYYSGYNAVMGFINGARDALPAVSNIGFQIGISIKNAVNGILRVNSPSKVFYDIGKSVDEGLVLGVSQNADEAIDAVSDVALRSIGAASEILAESILNDYSNPVIRPTLDLSEVASGASQINSMFDNGNIRVNGRYASSGNSDIYGGGNSNSIINNFTINAAPNQSVNDIAAAVEKRFNMVYRQRKAAGVS